MNEAVLNFEEIHDTYRPKIRRYLARMIGEEEAEDLTQEVFVKVHRALEGFKGDSKFSTWIYRIATNAALDKLRSPSFQRTAECVPLTEEVELQELASVEKVAAAEQEESSLEWEVFRRERLECYCDVLKDLPANYRAVVALSELGDLAGGRDCQNPRAERRHGKDPPPPRTGASAA
jgi:RNA polymerase sigma-70 factor (ECF subfamily)